MLSDIAFSKECTFGKEVHSPQRLSFYMKIFLVNLKAFLFNLIQNGISK